jgi:hypothetical protein
MRALLVVDVDATIKIYFKRAPFYNALIRSYIVKNSGGLVNAASGLKETGL